MKIIFVSSEAQPFSASGGLADVAGSLPQAVAAKGNECSVITPLYVNNIKPELKEKMTFLKYFYVPVGWRSQYCGVFSAELPGQKGVKYYFVDNQYYFERDKGLYGYYDDAERFAFFSRAVMEIISHLDLQPQIVHANDWQTALVPIYYYIYYKYQHNMRNIRTVFTIHNILYQGRYGKEILEDVLSIPRHMANIVFYDGDVNLMKGAFEVSDKITTVSPSYSKEILDSYFSQGLDGALKNKQYKTCGFLNGIDTKFYNPETDKNIFANFSAKKIDGKYKCKVQLLEDMKLLPGDEPVIGLISRLVSNKGFDLVTARLDQLVEEGAKLAILGSGEEKYQDAFYAAQARYPGKVSFVCGYVPDLARKIYAGADMFLMPSQSEPCGLAQMISLRYGTLPIVHSVGGLKDSIIDCGEGLENGGNGYTFYGYNADDMLGAVKRALGDYKYPDRWKLLVKNALKADFSWVVSADLYLGLYNEILSWQ